MPKFLTLDELIDHQSSYTPINFCLLEKIEGITVVNENIVSRYIKFVRAFAKEFNVNYEARDIYNYRPELLSSRLYGTPDLAWLIMMINSYDSPSRFVLRTKIQLIPKEELNELFIVLSMKNRTELAENHHTYITE